MNLEWLLTMRLITAGLLTVLYGWIRQAFRFFLAYSCNWRDTLGLVKFGVFGMAMSKNNIPYFRSIVIAGGALRRCCKYLAPSMIIYLVLMRYGKRPPTGEIISSYPCCFSRYYLLDGK